MAAAIEVAGLVKRYGDVAALDGVDFEVPEGTVLGLLGPNGAGKTTAVQVLTTLLRPDSGRATVAGVDVLADPQLARTKIGLAGQYAAVDEALTGRENLVMVGRLNHVSKADSRRRADELLERFDLSDAGGRATKTYSGGMRRRLDLAAALVDRPEVLFLDEPTTGLDPRARIDLWAVIEELVADGTTLLLTTQYLEEADRLADRIAVLNGGKVIANGTAAELKSQLGATVLELTLADAEAAARAEPLLADIGSAHADGALLRVSVADGPAAAVEVLRRLDSEGLRPKGLTLREPSLDDVFLSLTGEQASSTDAPAAESPRDPGRRAKKAA